MSTADIILVLFAIAGAWSGYKEGFLMELIALVAVILGVFCGFKLVGEGMLILEEKFNADKSTLPYISFLIIFIVVVILVHLLGRMIKHSIDKSFLGTMDQALGAALGVLRTLFVMSIVIWIFDSLKITPRPEWTENSWLYPFTAKLAPNVASWLGNYVPVFREIFREF